MPHIVGESVYLREYRIEDLEEIHSWRTLDEICWWTAAYVWPESWRRPGHLLKHRYTIPTLKIENS